MYADELKYADIGRAHMLKSALKNIKSTALTFKSSSSAPIPIQKLKTLQKEVEFALSIAIALEQGENTMPAIKIKGPRVLVKPDEVHESTKSGIILAETAQEKPQTGTVYAVGTGRLLNDGTKVPVDLKVGERVIYAKYAGTEMKYGNEQLVLINESDILAVIE